MGMGCAGALAGAGCLMLRRGWRWVPGVMTLGGIWAMVPDMPRIFREDFYWEPVSSVLGTYQLERKLHSWGDVFFFHGSLDAQPHEFALLGLVLILLFYNASILLLMSIERRSRNSLANRAWRAHRTRHARDARRRSSGRWVRDAYYRDESAAADEQHRYLDDPLPTPGPSYQPPVYDGQYDDQPAVLYRIGPRHNTGTDHDRV